jgi:GTP cyclohydrolase II
MFEMRVYKHSITRQDAVAMVARIRHGASLRRVNSAAYSPAVPPPDDGIILRVQDQCMTSEIFGSIKCDCKQQLDYSLALLHQQACRRYDRSTEVEAAPLLSRSAGLHDHHLASCPCAADAECSSAASRSHSHSPVEQLSTVLDKENGSGSSSSGSGASVGSTVTASLAGSGHESLTGDSDSEAENDKHSSLSTDALDVIGSEGADSERAGGRRVSQSQSPQPGSGSVSGSGRNSGSRTPALAAENAEAIVGLVVYLMQEGRGIGLAAKISAYALQEADDGSATKSHRHADDNLGSPSPSLSSSAPSPSSTAIPASPQRGLDTVDANRALGLPDDVREYSAVRDILADLGISSTGSGRGREAAQRADTQSEAGKGVYLLSNNPRKVALLKELGVTLAGRLPCAVPVSSPYAAAYLRTKVERMGHEIPAHVFSFADTLK